MQHVLHNLLGRARPSIFAAALAVVGVCGYPLHAEMFATRPTTVPTNWTPRYNGYVSDADTMAGLIGIDDDQRRIARDRLLLMTYEMEQWEELHGREGRKLQAAFFDIDRHNDPKAKRIAFCVWQAAVAPKDRIHDEHMSWIDENVLTAEQRDKWAAHELRLSVSFIEANGLMTVAQSSRVRPMALEVTAEVRGNYRDPRVREARKRRLIERIKAELLTEDQVSQLDALLQMWAEAEHEVSVRATTRPTETRK